VHSSFDTDRLQTLIKNYSRMQRRDRYTSRPATQNSLMRLARRSGIISARQQRKATKAMRRQAKA
jgi:hypothetical protein